MLFPADGFAEQFGGVSHAKLVLDPGAVGLDGFHAHAHSSAICLVRRPLPEKLKHFQFPIAQTRDGRLARRNALDEFLTPCSH